MPDASLNIGNARTLRWVDPGVLAYHRQRLGGLDFFRAMARGEIPAVPIYSVLDMRLTDVGRGYCRFECDTGPHMVNPVGGIHGGVYAILADSAAGIAAQSWIEEGSVTRTVRLNVDFQRPLTAESGTVVCEGRTAKVGRRIVLSDATIADREGRDAGRAQGTFMVVPATGSASPSGSSSGGPPPPAGREFLAEWGDTGAIRAATADRTRARTAVHDCGRPAARGADRADPRLQPRIRRRRRGDLPLRAGRAPVQPVGHRPWRCAGHPDRRGDRLRHPDEAAGRIQLLDRQPDLRVLPRHHARNRPVRCIGRIVKHGRQVSVADADVVDREGRVLVRGTATCLAHPLR